MKEKILNRYSLVTMLVTVLALVAVLAGCGENGVGEQNSEAGVDDRETQSITIYSGRSEELVGPILDQFEEATGTEVNVRYGDTAELAATILEEGQNSPADIYFGQDAGALGALAKEGFFAKLPDDLLNKVDARFRDPNGKWTGISGRPRVVAYNTDAVGAGDIPDSILDFTDPEWEERIGWPPTNGSFQAFVTAMRLELGDDATLDWLKGIDANNPREYPNNTSTVEAIGRGEVDVGFVNHYYLYRFKAEHGPDFPVENHYLQGGDPGALMNVAGVGILETLENKAAAEELLAFLLSESAQRYFAMETSEYPLVEEVSANPDLIPLDQLDTPDIDLSDLEDLEGTLRLLDEAGLL